MMFVAKQTSAARLEPLRAGEHLADERGRASAVGGTDLLQGALDEVGRQDPELSNE